MARFDVVPHPDKPGLSILDDHAMLNSLEITEHGLVELRDFLIARYPTDLVGSMTTGRRERIATAVLGGFAADPNLFTGDETAEGHALRIKYVANCAVSFADALIAALDAPTRRL